MGILKKLFSLFLTVVLLINFTVIGDYNVYAEISNNVGVNKEDRFEWENPLYKGLDIKTYSQNTQRNTSKSVVVYSLKEAAEKMRTGMVNRNSSISFTLKNVTYYSSIARDIFDLAIEDDVNGSSSEGDYLYWNYAGYTGYTRRYSDGTIEFNFNVSYLSNYMQERAVDAEVKRVLTGLNIEEKDDYTKAKLIHDYIVKNIKYDYSLNNYSTYNAIIEKRVVCQGFASLTYKMFKEAGLNVRVISGTGNGGPHGWNIVKIGDKFYNVDNTWDACYSESGGIRSDWFLKDNNNFPKHYRDSKYSTYSFHQKYPMATKSYEYTSVTRISLDIDDLEMNVGDTKKIDALVYPSNATNKSLTYKSGNENIVKIDKYGKITAVSYGEAYVYIRSNGGNEEKRCKITVKKPVYVTDISLNKKNISLIKGKTSVLVAQISPSNATNKKVTWKSSNTKVAKVDSNGKVTAVGVGSTTITATTEDGNKKATCKVNVEIYVDSVKLNKSTLNFVKGKNEILKATINPSNATNKKVTWKSSNTKVAKVNSSGKITGIKSGSATITVSTVDGNKIARCKVTVSNPIQVKSIKLNKTSLTLNKGKSETLKATINPSNATNKKVTWKSSNTKVVKVDSNGKVTAIGSGIANITATTEDGKKVVSCEVTVYNSIPISNLDLEKSELELKEGESELLNVNVYPSNATDKELKW